MEHRKLARLLGIAGGIALLGSLLMMFVHAPIRGSQLKQAYPGAAHLFWPGLTLFWVFGGLLLAALIQYWKICKNIGENRSFCPENVARMKTISVLLISAAALCVVPVILFLIHGITALWAEFAVFGMASLAMGMLAYALHKLLKNAAALQAENDLTV